MIDFKKWNIHFRFIQTPSLEFFKNYEFSFISKMKYINCLSFTNKFDFSNKKKNYYEFSK